MEPAVVRLACQVRWSNYGKFYGQIINSMDDEGECVNIIEEAGQ